MRYLVIVSLFITINLFAQDPKLSDNFTVEVGDNYESFKAQFRKIYTWENNVVSIKKNKRDLLIQKFDPVTLKEVERIEKRKFYPKNSFYLGIISHIQLGGNLLYFYSEYSFKRKSEVLMMRKISLESLEISEPKELIEQEGYFDRNILSGHYYGRMLFKKTFDDSKLLIMYRMNPEKKRDSKNFDKLVLNVFDSEMNAIWKEQIVMPYTEKKMNNLECTIDREGNFYMLALVYDDDTTDEKKRKKKDANYHLELFKVKKNTNAIVANRIDIEDKFIDEVVLKENTIGKITAVGTSKNPDDKGILLGRKKGQSTGIFIMNFDEEGAVKSFKNYNFPIEMLKKYTSDKSKKGIDKIDKKNREGEKVSFPGLKIHTVAYNSDGSIVVFGEQQQKVESQGQKGTNYTYYFNNILISKILPDGTLAWMDKLPKFQRGRHGKGTMSFKHVFAGDDHYLLYLDNIKNLNLSENERPHKHSDGKGGYFTAYVINDKTGNVNKEAIFDSRDFNGIELLDFNTNRIIRFSDSEILMEGHKKKDYLVKIKTKK